MGVAIQGTDEITVGNHLTDRFVICVENRGAHHNAVPDGIRNENHVVRGNLEGVDIGLGIHRGIHPQRSRIEKRLDGGGVAVKRVKNPVLGIKA